MLVARPTGVYCSHPNKGMVWLASRGPATRFRQPRDNLANGPMGAGISASTLTETRKDRAVAKRNIEPWDFHRQQDDADFGFMGDARAVPVEVAQRLAFEFADLAKKFWLPKAVPLPPRLKRRTGMKPDVDVMQTIVAATEYLIAIANSDGAAAWRAHNQIVAIHEAIAAQGREQEREHQHQVVLAADRQIREAAAQKQAGAFVYFIQAGEGGSIKIGVAANVQSRLKGLQTSHHEKLVLRATAPGGLSQEQIYHHQFAAHRLHGEWFSPHPDILAEIVRLNPEAS